MGYTGVRVYFGVDRYITIYNIYNMFEGTVQESAFYYNAYTLFIRDSLINLRHHWYLPSCGSPAPRNLRSTLLPNLFFSNEPPMSSSNIPIL